MDDKRFYSLFNAMVKCYKKKLSERSLFNNTAAKAERESFFKILDLRKRSFANIARESLKAYEKAEKIFEKPDKVSTVSKKVKLLNDYAYYLNRKGLIDQKTLLVLNSNMGKFIVDELKVENDS